MWTLSCKLNNIGSTRFTVGFGNVIMHCLVTWISLRLSWWLSVCCCEIHPPRMNSNVAWISSFWTFLNISLRRLFKRKVEECFCKCFLLDVKFYIFCLITFCLFYIVFWLNLARWWCGLPLLVIWFLGRKMLPCSDVWRVEMILTSSSFPDCWRF